MTEEQLGQLLAEVRSLLNANDLSKFDLRIDESSVRQDDDWCYVPIYPASDEIRAFEYAPHLATVEEHFKQQGTNILLVPAVGAEE